MEGRRIDDLLSRAIDEQVAEYRSWREAMESFAARVDRLDAVVQGLRAEVAGVVGDAARAAVSEAVETMSADLRHEISDLGRLILREPARAPDGAHPGSDDATHGVAPGEVDLRDPGRGEPPDPALGPSHPLDLPYVGEPARERRGRSRKR